ncbi:uncharacterized protein [Aristolochia californica]|uniref:uncharacterized protein n=1 Tax=Aristolochia californica TaxID=171875 RepID=UPI0035E2036D
MSGGFFRGTSADQDTRFSNKQAKLLKSQKFAPELDHLVDMKKVKIDVIKPWIAARATELLGFEDEVLINFIYGLLDAKNVDGKQIQIQLTGFMEKNTGKFMKELWALLLSAEKNASGIPQQFLDAKEEETRKKKVEADRITHEIQRKKEKEGRDYESTRKMDSDTDVSRVANISDGDFKKSVTARSDEESGLDERNGSERRTRLSRSPRSLSQSPTRRNTPSPVRSSSKSFSRSQSYSDERQKSRSMPRSPPKRRQSISVGRRYHSPCKHSVSPHSMQPPQVPRSSATRRLSPHSRRRSPSPRRRRLLSPRRRRSPSPRHRRPPSPRRHRSPSPRRHRSPSPRRRQSPSPKHLRSPSPRHLRSPSPKRCRSPPPNRRRSPPLSRRRSPSPLREMSRSPLRRRSPPIRRRSPLPVRRRSVSPRWRSALPSRRHSPSPLRRRSPPPRSPRQRRKSPVRSSPRRAVDSQTSPRKNYSPYRSPIPHRNRRSLSRDHDGRANGVGFMESHDEFASRRLQRKKSPVSPIPSASFEREAEWSGTVRKAEDSRKSQISLRSPQRDLRELSYPPNKGLRPERSPSLSHSPPSKRKKSPVVDWSSSESPPKQPEKRAVCYDILESSKEEIDIHHAREESGHGPVPLRKKASYSPTRVGMERPLVDFDHDEDSLGRKPANQSEVHRQRSAETSAKKVSPERHSQRTSLVSEEIEYSTGRMGKELLDQDCNEQLLAKHRGKLSYSAGDKLNADQVISKKSSSREDSKVHERLTSTNTNDEYGDHDRKTNEMQKSVKKMGRNGANSYGSDSEKRETSRSHKVEKRKYKKTESYVDDVEYDSQMDERKEGKRKRKEEKRLRKEEKRRRREERRRKKEERRAGKLKPQHVDTVTPPSDVERNQNLSGDTDGDVEPRRVAHTSDLEGTVLEQKKLEIDLRNKALESLRAKKAISH